MVILKCSEIIEQEFPIVGKLDLSVRQYESHPRIIYLGQGDQVIQIPEDSILELFDFLNKASELPLTHARKGWLK